MRYRKLDASGDYVFGRSRNDFLVNSTECVAQAVVTRLALLRGEWFLDTSDGTPYSTDILGKADKITRDRAIRERVLGTPNVTEITSYFSTVDANRNLSVNLTITTAFGITTVSTNL